MMYHDAPSLLKSLHAHPNCSKVRQRIHTVVNSIREERPIVDGESPRKKAILISGYLRDHGLTGITSNDEYHHIRHNFIGLALLDKNHSSLPLISVAIYCCVARHFGLDAHPCGFPFHVYAMVYPPQGLVID